MKLLRSYAGNSVAMVSQCPLLHELEVVVRKLVELVFHLPDRRLVEKPNRLRRRRLLVERLPQMRPISYKQFFVREFILSK